MVDQIAAYGVVNLHLKRNFQFGANAINAGYKYRVFVLERNREQAAKAANFAEDTLVEGFVSEILDALLGAVSAVNVYAGVSVSNRTGFRHGFLGHDYGRSGVAAGLCRTGINQLRAAHCSTL